MQPRKVFHLPKADEIIRFILRRLINNMKNSGKFFKYLVVLILSLFVSLSASFAKSEETSIKIDAVPFMISPNNDGDLDSTTINLEAIGAEKIKAWALDIKNDKGDVIRKMSWPDEMPGIIKWDGKDSYELPVPDGKYSIVLTAQLKKNKVLTSSSPVIVDCSPPTGAISVKPEVFSPNNDGKDDAAEFGTNVNDLTFIARWQLKITDENGTVAMLFKGQGAPPENISWDGKDSYYKKVVPDGVYTARMILEDSLRNSGETPGIKVRVFIPPKVITKEIKVKEEDKGIKVNLSSNILFGEGRAKLQDSSHKALDEVVTLVKAYPENKVAIEGHTDSVGSGEYNKKLSLERAQAIAEYLISKGIPKERFLVKGYGEEKPIASNKTRAGQLKNRRVEITILKSEKK